MRLGIIKLIFEHSETTTVHMKGWSSGSSGVLPFVTAIVKGLMANNDD
jgi:hypothetical protein